MKICPECQGTYPNDRLRCPYDGAELQPVLGADVDAQSILESPEQSNTPRDVHVTLPYLSTPEIPPVVGGARTTVSPAVPLVRRTLFGYQIEGIITEISAQQYYPTTFSKAIRSFFGGEPYQFGHTSFTTIIRVTQQQDIDIPELARDVILYGNAQNILTPGDDVRISAARRRGTYVAKRIFNHSSDSWIHFQEMIPASLIRILGLIFIWLCLMLIRFLLRVDYIALIQSLIAAVVRIISPFISYILTGAIMFVLIRYLITGGKR